MEKYLLKSLYENGINVKKIEISIDEYERLNKVEPGSVYSGLVVVHGENMMKYYAFEDVVSFDELGIELKIKQYEAICKTRDFTKYIFILILISFISSILAGFVFLLPLLQ